VLIANCQSYISLQNQAIAACSLCSFLKGARQAQNRFRIFEIQKQAAVERICENKLEIKFLEFI